jgi:CheY-like chemotaxis protein
MRTASVRPTLLLVDDCIAERDVYDVVLQRAFNIVTASRGADAVALAASEQPDIVVLGVMIPATTGRETCTRIKRDAGRYAGDPAEGRGRWRAVAARGCRRC